MRLELPALKLDRSRYAAQTETAELASSSLNFDRRRAIPTGSAEGCAEAVVPGGRKLAEPGSFSGQLPCSSSVTSSPHSAAPEAEVARLSSGRWSSGPWLGDTSPLPFDGSCYCCPAVVEGHEMRGPVVVVGFGRDVGSAPGQQRPRDGLQQG